MGVIFGLLSALSIGLSDLFGRRVVNARGPILTGTVMQFVAIFTSLFALVIVSSELIWDDLLVGLLSGLGLGIGLVCYFTGLTHSTSTVVSPVVATLSAVIPFVYTIVRGTSPSLVALLGAIVAFVGLALITAGGGRAAHIAAGVRWGLVSGLGYGFGLSVIIEASDSSGSWPAVTQRVAAFALMLLVAKLRQVNIVPPSGLRFPSIVAGMFAGLSTVLFLLGVEADATSAVVTASLFPVVTVVVGRLVYGDGVKPVQAGGIAVVLVGVIGVATG